VLNAQDVFLDFVDVSDAADFAFDTNNPSVQKHDLTIQYIILALTSM
jgi:hypothetical protein